MQNNHTEIERKFLVRGEYKHQATSHSHIVQAYMKTEPGVTVRVRRRDSDYYLTIKGPSTANGLSRFEFERKVEPSEGESLLRLCTCGRVEKIRWLVPDGLHTVEVDEFLGDNSPLVMAEIELRSEDDEPVLPSFLGKELTGDHRFSNKYLTRHPFSLWRHSFEEEQQTEERP